MTLFNHRITTPVPHASNKGQTAEKKNTRRPKSHLDPQIYYEKSTESFRQLAYPIQPFLVIAVKLSIWTSEKDINPMCEKHINMSN